MSKKGDTYNVFCLSPPVFSSTYSGIVDAEYPKVLSFEKVHRLTELKQKIYLYARNYFLCPFVSKNDELSELDKEKHKYRTSKKEDNFNTEKLFALYKQEYLDIFSENENNQMSPEISTNTHKKKQAEKFLNDFPYKIVVRMKFGKQNEDMTLFEGRNFPASLGNFDIYSDEDKINKLIEKIEKEKLYFFLIIKPESKYSIANIKLDSCENYQAPYSKNNENLTLDDLIEYFCSDERLDEGNQWFCTKCKNKVKVNKKFSIFFVPRLLIICLNRFEKHSGNYQKNDDLIKFPLEDLDMGKYLCGPDKEHSKYDLFAVSQHYGNTGGGHYTAVCKNIDGNWYDYNDSSCTKTSPKGVVNNSAYVLFYRKKNW